jgi:hypothetical protein
MLHVSKLLYKKSAFLKISAGNGTNGLTHAEQVAHH